MENYEFGINIYTLIYTKQINNKDQLYSTWNCTQYFVIRENNLNISVCVCVCVCIICCIIHKKLNNFALDLKLTQYHKVHVFSID